MKVIFAQGNPGEKYTKSRHNVGFMIIDELAKDAGAQWKEKTKLRAYVAEVTLGDEKAVLVKPTTYYNETGLSARSVLDFYKLSAESDFLVIHDDLSLPIGTIRVRKQGSDAGNNGIKSLNSHIGQDYSRIRVGIWNELRDLVGDADFVLSNFKQSEAKTINDSVTPQVLKVVSDFIAGSVEYTSHRV